MDREFCKLVERLAGSGTLVMPDGSSLSVFYVLDVIRNFFDVGASQPPVPGSMEIDGKVAGLKEAELLPLIGQDLTLVLQDNRKIPIQLQPTGSIILRGDFPSSR